MKSKVRVKLFSKREKTASSRFEDENEKKKKNQKISDNERDAFQFCSLFVKHNGNKQQKNLNQE